MLIRMLHHSAPYLDVWLPFLKAFHSPKIISWSSSLSSQQKGRTGVLSFLSRSLPVSYLIVLSSPIHSFNSYISFEIHAFPSVCLTTNVSVPLSFQMEYAQTFTYFSLWKGLPSSHLLFLLKRATSSHT